MGLYDDIIGIAREFMGPAAEDYMRRRIRIVQQGKAPEEIAEDRLERLAVGIEMTAKVYMSDRKAAQFRERLLELQKNGHRK